MKHEHRTSAALHLLPLTIMAPIRKELPGALSQALGVRKSLIAADFDVDGDQIRCRICHGASGAGFRDSQSADRHWISRGSLASHLSTQMHKNNVSVRAQEAAKALDPSGTSSLGAGASLPTVLPSAYIPTPASTLYMQQPLQHTQPAFPQFDSARDDISMDIDSEPIPGTSPTDLDDLMLTEEEHAELEHRQLQDDELHFVRALAELSLGGPQEAQDGEAPQATHPLDEIAEFEGEQMTQ